LILTIISWAAVVAVLGAYLSGRMHIYDWVNVCACVPIALPALLAGAYSSGSLNLAFGSVGVVHLIRKHRMNKAWKAATKCKLN